MSIEDTIKQNILSQYKSVRAFTQAINIPYSTIDSMLKKGVRRTAVQTVIRVCDSLGLDLNAISYKILYSGKENKHLSKPLEGPSEEAMEVAYAYDKADFKSKNTARHALDLPMLVTKNHLIENTSSVDDKSAYSLPLFEQIAQAEGEYIKNISNGVPKTALSASSTTKDDDEKAV